jgi:hypothetical protein
LASFRGTVIAEGVLPQRLKPAVYCAATQA